MNRKELSHIWANQTDEELERERSVRASAAFFNGPAFFHHSTVLARIYRKNGARLVLLDSARFSATTSQVQSSLRSALRASDINVSLSFGRRGQSLLLTPLQIWEAAKAEALDYATQASKARGRGPSLLKCAELSVDKAESVRRFFGLRNKPFAPDLSTLAEKMKEETKKAAEREVRRQTKQREFVVKFGPEMIELWRTHQEMHPRWLKIKDDAAKIGLRGLDLAPLFSAPDFSANALLRLSVDGSRVETSKGAQVLTRTVRFLWAFCMDAKRNALPVAADLIARFPRLDNYNASAIDAGGNLTAGCHRIPFAEVQEIARALKLPPFNGELPQAPTIPTEEVSA
jgi:hypothetical protein